MTSLTLSAMSIIVVSQTFCSNWAFEHPLRRRDQGLDGKKSEVVLLGLSVPVGGKRPALNPLDRGYWPIGATMQMIKHERQ